MSPPLRRSAGFTMPGSLVYDFAFAFIFRRRRHHNRPTPDVRHRAARLLDYYFAMRMPLAPLIYRCSATSLFRSACLCQLSARRAMPSSLLLSSRAAVEFMRARYARLRRVFAPRSAGARMRYTSVAASAREATALIMLLLLFYADYLP